ncbi:MULTISPECIES: ArsR/SmtB family transcription factor [Halorussus]|uniref:ArsR/SmtB family transcription factor n=1 Tax=Halorussus TaxID=1070314 RepID=UPI00209D3309|nr:metalloregulator ArsR/SmtB family transcription factor [Halorussus vallis]USZ73986.1 metalloregulator ArsR/SmtB family transcription factor [Halorussus vallis]
MAQANDRLRRLVADEVGDCCDADLEAHLDDLRALDGETDPDAIPDRVRVLSALASDTRYRIVQLLAAAEEDLCVCELTPLLDVSDSAVSHALSELTDAGLVSRRKQGKWRYYGATERAEALLGALGDGAVSAEVER